MLRVISAFVFGSVLGFFIFNSGIKPILATDNVNPTPIGSPKPTAEAATPEPTIVPTPTSTPTPLPTVTPTPQPTLKATADAVIQTPIGSPKPIAAAASPSPIPNFSHQQINELIQNFGGQYGIDPNILRHIALCESEFNPLAKNGPYWGLFQFGSITWQNFRYAMKEDPDTNLRLNAEEAIQTAAYALTLGKTHIWPNCYPN